MNDAQFLMFEKYSPSTIKYGSFRSPRGNFTFAPRQQHQNVVTQKTPWLCKEITEVTYNQSLELKAIPFNPKGVPIYNSVKMVGYILNTMNSSVVIGFQKCGRV